MFQVTRHYNYSGKLLHMIVYFQKLWKTDLKQAWHDYCLINPSKRSDKYCANNCFEKTIIKKNKDKVRLFANAKSHEFLKKMMGANIIFLVAIKEVLDRESSATRYGNHHSIISRMVEVSTFIYHLVKKSVFKAQPGCGYNCKKAKCVDFYSCRVALLVKKNPVG